jgi:hypothetical protein
VSVRFRHNTSSSLPLHPPSSAFMATRCRKSRRSNDLDLQIWRLHIELIPPGHWSVLGSIHQSTTARSKNTDGLQTQLRCIRSLNPLAMASVSTTGIASSSKLLLNSNLIYRGSTSPQPCASSIAAGDGLHLARGEEALAQLYCSQ